MGPIESATMIVVVVTMTVVVVTMTGVAVVAEIMTATAITIVEIMIVEITNTIAIDHAYGFFATAKEFSPRLWSIHEACSTTNLAKMSERPCEIVQSDCLVSSYMPPG